MRRPGATRRLTIWLAVGWYGLVASGLPLPLGVVRDGGREGRGQKDRSVPYPCMDSPCGCGSAEQCYANCCCHTPAERLAWARARGLEDVVASLIALRSKAVPSQAAGSAAGPGLSHQLHEPHGSDVSDGSDGCAAKRSCCESGSTSRPRGEPAGDGRAVILSPVAGSKTPPSWPWKKSSETFSRHENLRFSRVLCTRHVIPDVRQAVVPQPARGPGICSAYRHLAGGQASHRTFASPGSSRCDEGIVMDRCERDRCGDSGDSTSRESGSRDAEGGRPGTPRGGRSVTLRAMLACGGIGLEWLSVGGAPPPPPVAAVASITPIVEAILPADVTLSCERAAPAAPPPRVA